MRTLLLLGLVGGGLLACGEPAVKDPGAEQPPLTALIGIPMPRSAVNHGATGQHNSVEVSLTDTIPPDSVATFYRVRLLQLGWNIQSDAHLPDGGVSLHATKDSKPVWILIYPGDAGGTRFSVVTGVPDSAASGPARPAARDTNPR